MAQLEIDGSELVVRLSTKERWGALRRGDVRVPVTSVASIETVEAASRHTRGMRAPGTGWPGKIALGTWRKGGGKDFVAAYRRDPGVVIELDGQEFRRFVISGDVPDDVLALG